MLQLSHSSSLRLQLMLLLLAKSLFYLTFFEIYKLQGKIAFDLDAEKYLQN